MVEINWVTVRKGLVISLILWIILREFAGDIGGIVGFLAATIYVGYKANDDYMNGAAHGALVGIVGGIVGGSIILILYLIGLGETAKQLWPVTGVIEAIIIIVLYGIIGGIGGSVGSLIKRS
jgi:CDP-diglyceride synthetase